MNAFLAGLVDRAQGRVTVLERRPRALFEPAVPHVDVAAAQVDATDAREPADRSTTPPPNRDADRVARPSHPARQPPPDTTHRRDAAARIEPQAAAPRADGDRQRASPTMPAAPPTLRHPAATTRAGNDATAPLRERTRSTATALRESPATTPARPATPPPSRPLGPAAAPTREPMPTLGRAAVAEHVPRPAAASAVPRVTTVASAVLTRPATPAYAHPAVQLARARAAAPAQREAPAAVAPTPVHISIGRVEVRAVAAPAAQRTRGAHPATSPGEPRLSLDDYLRQRHGAAR